MIEGNHHQCLRALATITALTHFPTLKRHFTPATANAASWQPWQTFTQCKDFTWLVADSDSRWHWHATSLETVVRPTEPELLERQHKSALWLAPCSHWTCCKPHTHTHQICAECVKHPADTFTDLRYIWPKQTSEQINFDCFRLQCSAQLGLARLGSAPFGVGQATLGVASRRVSFLFFGDHGRCLLLLLLWLYKYSLIAHTHRSLVIVVGFLSICSLLEA